MSSLAASSDSADDTNLASVNQKSRIELQEERAAVLACQTEIANHVEQKEQQSHLIEQLQGQVMTSTARATKLSDEVDLLQMSYLHVIDTISDLRTELGNMMMARERAESRVSTLQKTETSMIRKAANVNERVKRTVGRLLQSAHGDQNSIPIKELSMVLESMDIDADHYTVDVRGVPVKQLADEFFPLRAFPTFDPSTPMTVAHMVHFAMKGTEKPALLMDNMIQVQLKLLNTTVTNFTQYTPYVYKFLLDAAMSALARFTPQEACMALMMLAQFFGLSPVEAPQAKAILEDLELLKNRGVLINTCAQRLLAVVCRVHPSLQEEIRDPDVKSHVEWLRTLPDFGRLPYLLKLVKSKREDVWCAEAKTDALELDGREKPVTRLFLYRDRTHPFTRGLELMIIIRPDWRQMVFRGKHNVVFEKKPNGLEGMRITLTSTEGPLAETFWAELGSDFWLYYQEWRAEEYSKIHAAAVERWAAGIL